MKKTIKFCSQKDGDRTWYYTRVDERFIYGSGSWNYDDGLIRFKGIVEQIQDKTEKVLDCAVIETKEGE